ncbi:hypothetical protein VP01_1870g2 [Puccinia sorghi]|uniref:Uncharacterized protein n=1 Tax=Puccinia sorghi TaxID=27349 RepID=A0A0L6VDD1_9BASI|nr:hypothetical protein VP01_1870g2 [Puccinia sorghi]
MITPREAEPNSNTSIMGTSSHTLVKVGPFLAPSKGGMIVCLFVSYKTHSINIGPIRVVSLIKDEIACYLFPLPSLIMLVLMDVYCHCKKNWIKCLQLTCRMLQPSVHQNVDVLAQSLCSLHSDYASKLVRIVRFYYENTFSEIQMRKNDIIEQVPLRNFRVKVFPLVAIKRVLSNCHCQNYSVVFHLHYNDKVTLHRYCYSIVTCTRQSYYKRRNFSYYNRRNLYHYKRRELEGWDINCKRREEVSMGRGPDPQILGGRLFGCTAFIALCMDFLMAMQRLHSKISSCMQGCTAFIALCIECLMHAGLHSLYCIVHGIFGGKMWTTQKYMRGLQGLQSPSRFPPLTDTDSEEPVLMYHFSSFSPVRVSGSAKTISRSRVSSKRSTKLGHCKKKTCSTACS